MADDWLTSANTMDGIGLDNGLDSSGEGPALLSNISALLRNTQRDKADLEARVAQLRGFIQQTDEVMKGIANSGDPSLEAKYNHLAATRRSLWENANHLMDLLDKVTVSETRARQLAEQGRHLTSAEQLTAEVAAAEGINVGAMGGGGGGGPQDRPDHEQKVAVVRGRPGPGAAGRRREASGAAPAGPGPEILRQAVIQNSTTQDRFGTAAVVAALRHLPLPQQPQSQQQQQQQQQQPQPREEDEAEDADQSLDTSQIDRLLRSLRSEPLPARPAPPPPPPAMSLAGAESAIREKAHELETTRQKLQHLRQLMSVVQEARQAGGVGSVAAAAPMELRSLLREVEAELDGPTETAESSESGQPDRPVWQCDDCRCGAPGQPPLASRPAGGLHSDTCARDLPAVAANLPRARSGSVASAGGGQQTDRPARAASLAPAAGHNVAGLNDPVSGLNGPVTAAAAGRSVSLQDIPGPAGDDEFRAQLQNVTALMQSLTRQPWLQQPAMWPGPYQPPPPPSYQLPPSPWLYPHTDLHHQQTMSALSQCFHLLQNQQQQILEMQRQMQTSAAAAVSAASSVLTQGGQPSAPARPFLLRPDEPAALEAVPDGALPQSGGVSMLNNQVAPGCRANNYWDNFRSYSRQNLLSGGSEPEGERPRGSESEPHDDLRAEGFMSRPRLKKQKVNRENQQLDRPSINTRPAVGAEAGSLGRPRATRASTPQAAGGGGGGAASNPQADAVYSCVTALIAQNQDQPEFLIELLHDLQLVRTERQRQQVLHAVQTVVVQEVSGGRHKQPNRPTGSGGAASAAAAASVASVQSQQPLAAEREQIKSHFVRHTKNLSQSMRPEQPESGGLTEAEEATIKNLAPLLGASSKNTTKPKTFERTLSSPVRVGPLPDGELQLARVLHELAVFLSDHQGVSLSPTLLARLERLLLRACAQNGLQLAELNRLLEETMVPYMGQLVSEAGELLQRAVAERLGAALRGRELPASPPPPPPPSRPQQQDSESESEDDQRPLSQLAAEPQLPAGRPATNDRRADTDDSLPTGGAGSSDEGPQVIPEQEVRVPLQLNGRVSVADRQARRASDPAPPGAICRNRPARDTPEPDTNNLECMELAEADT